MNTNPAPSPAASAPANRPRTVTRLVPLMLAVPVLAAFGVVEGRWTNRWHQSHAIEDATRALAQVPPTVGEWEGVEREVPADDVVAGDIRAYLRRDYVHRPTGKTVSVVVVVGEPGPIVVHTPNLCYPRSGFEQFSPQEREVLEVEGPVGRVEMWRAGYRSPGLIPVQQRVRWCWTATGPWRAPTNPRLAFAGYPALYKFYTVQQVAEGDDPSQDASLDFLRHFLPQLHERLFAPPAPATGDRAAGS
jgi:hypothetical protein